jgi:hypothetical protein
VLKALSTRGRTPLGTWRKIEPVPVPLGLPWLGGGSDQGPRAAGGLSDPGVRPFPASVAPNRPSFSRGETESERFFVSGVGVVRFALRNTVSGGRTVAKYSC